MNDFKIPKHLIIYETDEWILNHRVNSALPGYLILGSRMPTTDLSMMASNSLNQLGFLLAQAQKALTQILSPRHLYVARYGHTAGHSFHFHLIPICEWLKQSFFADRRYRVLRDISRASGVGGNHETDGAELTLYVWREFCENPSPPPVSGPPVHEVIERLKTLMSL
jgi:diadenosine tetraphosphate (Ap4A) HIT family hydrolase